MPVKRRTQKKRLELDDQARLWLEGDDHVPWHYFQTPDELRALWLEHSAELVAEHVAEHPGTRPARWWTYSAPEPRLRLGGVGTTFESQAAYLDRHKLFLPGERRRLTSEDFEPELTQEAQDGR